MKIKKFNENIKIFESIEEIENKFDNAIRTGRSETINTDLNGWSEFKSKYYLCDNYYYYKDTIFEYNEKPSGDWFSEEITVSKKSTMDFKEYLFNKIEELTVAFNKIDL